MLHTHTRPECRDVEGYQRQGVRDAVGKYNLLIFVPSLIKRIRQTHFYSLILYSPATSKRQYCTCPMLSRCSYTSPSPATITLLIVYSTLRAGVGSTIRVFIFEDKIWTFVLDAPIFITCPFFLPTRPTYRTVPYSALHAGRTPSSLSHVRKTQRMRRSRSIDLRWRARCGVPTFIHSCGLSSGAPPRRITSNNFIMLTHKIRKTLTHSLTHVRAHPREAFPPINTFTLCNRIVHHFTISRSTSNIPFHTSSPVFLVRQTVLSPSFISVAHEVNLHVYNNKGLSPLEIIPPYP